MTAEQTNDALELLATITLNLINKKEIKHLINKSDLESLKALQTALKAARWDAKKRKNAWLNE